MEPRRHAIEGTDDSTNFLVITPHPDDAEGGAGGTIARWTAQGRKGVLVVCTNGDKGSSDRGMVPEVLAETREKEQRRAAEAMGISEVVFLKFPDQGLEDSSEFREALVKQIRIHKPHHLYTGSQVLVDFVCDLVVTIVR